MTTSTEVPGRYPVAVDGRGYLVDEEEFRHVTIPQIKPQADTGDEQGEGALNPEALWRRYQNSWHFGAGQTYFDKPDSDRARFRESLHIDPWTKGEASLLKKTTLSKTLAGFGYLLVVGTYLYLYDTSANKLYYTTDLTVWTEVTGLSASGAPGVSCIATDGYNVYIAQAANGIYKTTRGAATATSWVTGTVECLGYVRGRLLAATDNNLYNVTASGALPSALLTHPNSDFHFYLFAETQSNIYVGGYSGDKGLIYRTSIKADGTALDVPVVAGELPDGEIGTALQGYLGYLLVGTSRGVRFSTTDSDGNLTLGAVIEITSSPPLCFEPQSNFVWFGWSNYDATWTGIGRLNLQYFTDTAGLVPAYASDLMAQDQGLVTGVVTFLNRRVFTVATGGVYAEHETDYEDNGLLYSGFVTFGLAEKKIPRYLDVRGGFTNYPNFGGTITGKLGDNRRFYSTVGVQDGTEGRMAVSSAIREFIEDHSEALETYLFLEPNGDNSLTPTATRWTLLADVIANQGYFIYLPLVISESEDAGYPDSRDLAAEVALLKALRDNRTVVTYQEGATEYEVTVDDYEWEPTSKSEEQYQGGAYNGVFTLKLKVA